MAIINGREVPKLTYQQQVVLNFINSQTNFPIYSKFITDSLDITRSRVWECVLRLEEYDLIDCLVYGRGFPKEIYKKGILDEVKDNER